MGLDLYGPHFVTGDSAVAALVRTLNQLVENILAGATPATGSVTDAKVAEDAAIAQSKIAGLVAELATKLNAAGIVAKAAATTNQDLNGLDVVDGYQTVAGDQVLLTAQTAPTENGPWVVAAGAWARPADFATGSTHAGRAIVVSGGTLAGSVWTLNTTAPVTVGTTAQTWVNAPVRSGTLVQATGGGREAVVASSNSGAAATIDLSTGNIVPHTLTANCTFTMPTVTGGVMVQFTHELTQDATGSRTATYPASVKWPDGVAPVLSTAPASVDVLVFYTRDDGATWRGALSARYTS